MFRSRNLNKHITEVSDWSCCEPSLMIAFEPSTTSHHEKARHIIYMDMVCILPGLCSKIVGIFQLCDQVAHDLQPGQDVPDFLNPKSAPQWARSEQNQPPPAAPRNIEQQKGQKQSKWHRNLRIKGNRKCRKCPVWPSQFCGRTPTPAKDPRLILASLMTLPPQAGPSLTPPYAWISTSKQVLH